jgi:hypothetical protein
MASLSGSRLERSTLPITTAYALAAGQKGAPVDAAQVRVLDDPLLLSLFLQP